MSNRKRHTAALDFMRLFILAERGKGDWGDCYGPGFGSMVDRLLKRGWLAQHRVHINTRWGKNYLRSTAKGRRAVYQADRHSEPAIRPHAFGAIGMGGWKTRWMVESHRRTLARLDRASVSARDLHGSR